MTSSPSPTDTDGSLPTSLPEFASRVYAYTAQFPRNLHTALTSPSSKDYLRLITIVGAYILLRPWIEKFFAWWMDAPKPVSLAQAREDARRADQIEREVDPTTGLPKTLQPKAVATVGAGAIRGQPQPQQIVGEKDEAETSAREDAVRDGEAEGAEDVLRQRQQKKALLEAYEKEMKSKNKGVKQAGKEGYDPVLLEGWDY